MSYSPSRVRRNSIFSEKKPRRANLFNSSASQAPYVQLQHLQRKLTTFFQRQLQPLLHEIDQNQKTIQSLEARLRQNEEEINRKNYLIHKSGFAPGLIEQLIQAQLNKRLNIVSKKFSEMEDAFVVNMLPVIEKSPDSNRNSSGIENDFAKFKGHMDQKLNDILVGSNNTKDSIARKCWEISEQIRINEQVMDSMNVGIENIRSKIFSLDTLLKSIQGKGEEIKSAIDGKIVGLRDELNRLNINIANIENRLQNPMMRKHRDRQRDSQRERLRESNERLVTSIKDFRREVLHKDDISEISSISSSMSFLPNPVFVPKMRTNPSYNSTPNSKFLANTKVTTIPLRQPTKPPNSKPLPEDSSDEFLDLYRQSSLQLTKQIMSPFQQAEYITSENSPLDNTKSAFTLPLKPLQSNIQDRVRQTIFRKKLITPIPAYLDNNNYIKKANGAYLFDWQGEVLKSSPHEFKRLCNINLFVER